MGILQWFGILIASLTALLIASDRFTTTAEKIGVHFKIPAFIIGVTIVAIGTSMPEIITSVIAVLENESAIVVGNVIGSNIANILLIIGVTAVVSKKMIVDKDILSIDLPILLGSTILVYFSSLDGKITYLEGILFLIGLVIYIMYNVQSRRTIDEEDMKTVKQIKKELIQEKKEAKLSVKYPILLLVFSALIYLSADWTINAVIEIATILKISTEVIAITIVALGTSLPELTVSIMAGLKGKSDIAIGNVVGSKIFNIFGAMGIASLIGDIHGSQDAITFTIPAMILVTILYIFITMDKSVTRWEGATLLLIYIAFIGKVVGLV